MEVPTSTTTAETAATTTCENTRAERLIIACDDQGALLTQKLCDAIYAATVATGNPLFFTYKNKVVMIEDGKPVKATPAKTRAAIDELVTCTFGRQIISVPWDACCALLQGHRYSRIIAPELLMIVNGPRYVLNGKGEYDLVDKPGYHPESRTMFLDPLGLMPSARPAEWRNYEDSDGDPVPVPIDSYDDNDAVDDYENSTGEVDENNVKWALEALAEPFIDFVFRDPIDHEGSARELAEFGVIRVRRMRGRASRANLMSLQLTAQMRPAFAAAGVQVPMFAFSKDRPQVGATKCARTAMMPVLGYAMERHRIPNSRPGWEKLADEVAAEGDAVFLDNLPPQLRLDSGALASALTSPNGTIVILTGNDLTARPELIERMVPIGFKAEDAQPGKRTGFKYAEVEKFAREFAPKTMRALAVLVENWKQKGCPLADIAFGAFTPWARIVGGILEAAGVYDFLDNRDGFKKQTDKLTVGSAEPSEISAFVAACFHHYGTNAGRRLYLGEAKRFAVPPYNAIVAPALEYGRTDAPTYERALALQASKVAAAKAAIEAIEAVKRAVAEEASILKSPLSVFGPRQKSPFPFRPRAAAIAKECEAEEARDAEAIKAAKAEQVAAKVSTAKAAAETALSKLSPDLRAVVEAGTVPDVTLDYVSDKDREIARQRAVDRNARDAGMLTAIAQDNVVITIGRRTLNAGRGDVKAQRRELGRWLAMWIEKPQHVEYDEQGYTVRLSEPKHERGTGLTYYMLDVCEGD